MNNPVLDQSALSGADSIQQNLMPATQQTSPTDYYKLAGQLQDAQIAQRNQRQALNGGQVMFQNEQQRQDYFAKRDLQNANIDTMAKQMAALPRPSAGQLNPVDLSKTPLTDPMSQLSRLHAVGGMDILADGQKDLFMQRSQDELAHRSGIDKTAMDKWQGKSVNPLTADQLFNNPKFLALAQTDPAKANQVSQAVLGQDLGTAQQHLQVQKAKLAEIGVGLIKEKTATNDFVNLPDGTVLMAQLDPLSKQRVWYSPKGDDKNDGMNPAAPKRMAAATYMALLHGADALGMRVQQLGTAASASPQAQIKPKPDGIFASLQNGQGASPTPANSYFNVPVDRNSGQTSPDWNGAGAGPVMADPHTFATGMANTGQRALGWLGKLGQTTLEAALGRESDEDNTPTYTEDKRTLDPIKAAQLAQLLARKH